VRRAPTPQDGLDMDALSFSSVSTRIGSDRACRVSSSPPASATTASKAGDDDIEESDDAVDNCGQDCADTIHNGHQDATDGSADSLET